MRVQTQRTLNPSHYTHTVMKQTPSHSTITSSFLSSHSHISDHQFPSIECQRISSSKLAVILIPLAFTRILLRAESDQSINDSIFILFHHQITIQIPKFQEQLREFAVIVFRQNIEISHHQLSRAIIPMQSVNRHHFPVLPTVHLCNAALDALHGATNKHSGILLIVSGLKHLHLLNLRCFETTLCHKVLPQSISITATRFGAV